MFSVVWLERHSPPPPSSAKYISNLSKKFKDVLCTKYLFTIFLQQATGGGGISWPIRTSPPGHYLHRIDYIFRRG